jgi:hypothetical protein
MTAKRVVPWSRVDRSKAPSSPLVPQNDPGDLLRWSEQNREFGGQKMRVPGPLRAIYRDQSPRLTVMKGAQLGFSEWIINLMLWTADSSYAGRGTSLYVQPTGSSAGDFVQGRVRPAIDQSDYLTARMGKVLTGRASDPDKVGLMRLGDGYCYWRTARSKSGLKSVPADVLALDEFDEMPIGTLDLASHRLDSSAAPRIALISTPTYPAAGIDIEYRRGDQRVFMIPCNECGTLQSLEWAKNVQDGVRVCVRCRESIEAQIARAWDVGDIGEWHAQNPDADARSYQLSQLYRPDADLVEMARALSSSDVTTLQEAWNQHLGLPFSPPGGQLSYEELKRICTAPFTMADIAGVQGCFMGVDVGARLHVWITWDTDQFGPEQRYLVGAYEVSEFSEVDELMQRFGVRMCVVDAHPELRSAKAFQLQHPGRVYLCNYTPGRMPPLIPDPEGKDPQRRWTVQVDRTAAMDALSAGLRSARIVLPVDAESVPGLFAMLQAPVRRLVRDPRGNLRAEYDEGSRPDHFYHAGLYAELASYIGGAVIQQGNFDARTLSNLGAWDRG